MLTLDDGRSELWQWDTGRTLAVDADCSQVHFSNKVFGRSIDVDVVGGAAIIPDVLLQTDKDLNVWAFVGTAENGYTKISKTFKVNRRNKPADYVFTPPDQTTLAELSGRLDRIEESQAPDAIKNAVDNYLKQNPVEAPVKSVNGKTGAVELNAEEVGALPNTYTPPVDATLTQSGQAADAAAVGEQLSSLSGKIVTTSESKVSAHNTGTDTHSDIRLLISGLTDRLNALADSDDTTLDQLSEVVAYIKSNRDLISSITTDKVSVADIVDNLTTNVANKPLSAAQGVALKALIDAISIPDKLPNPNALTFTGAVTGSYDGSAPLEVEIPSGGGEKPWRYDKLIEFSEDTAGFTLDTFDDGSPFDFTEIEVRVALKNASADAVWVDVKVYLDGTDGNDNQKFIGGSDSSVSAHTGSGKYYMCVMQGYIDLSAKTALGIIAPNVVTTYVNSPLNLSKNPTYQYVNYSYSTQGKLNVWKVAPTKFTSVTSSMTIGAGSSVWIRGR